VGRADRRGTVPRIQAAAARHEEEGRDNRDDLPRRCRSTTRRGRARCTGISPTEPHAPADAAELRNHRELPEPEARFDRPRGCPPVPVRGTASSSARRRGPVIVRIVARRSPRSRLRPRIPPPRPCRGDAAKQTHRGRANVRANRELVEAVGQSEPNATAPWPGAGDREGWQVRATWNRSEELQEPFFHLHGA